MAWRYISCQASHSSQSSRNSKSDFCISVSVKKAPPLWERPNLKNRGAIVTRLEPLAQLRFHFRLTLMRRDPGMSLFVMNNT